MNESDGGAAAGEMVLTAEALVFPAQGVPFVPLAADLQEVAPGALALPLY